MVEVAEAEAPAHDGGIRFIDAEADAQGQGQAHRGTGQHHGDDPAGL
jgi:hypothetical protein